MDIFRNFIIASGCVILGASGAGVAAVLSSNLAYGACVSDGGGPGGGGGGIISVGFPGNSGGTGGTGGSSGGGAGSGGGSANRPTPFGIGSGGGAGGGGGGGGGGGFGGVGGGGGVAQMVCTPLSSSANPKNPALAGYYAKMAQDCRSLAARSADPKTVQQYKSLAAAYEKLGDESGGDDTSG